MASFGSDLLAVALAGTAAGEHPLRHVAELPPRSGRPHGWPAWAEPDVVRAFADRGISAPWSHQVEAAELAHAGRHVVVSTGTASGKSLAYQLPVLNALATDPRARVLYLSPTKALGHDQLRAAHALTAAVPRLASDRRAHRLRRRQSRRGAPLRPRTLPLAVFQPRHDPSVDTAQPCPLGRPAARPSVRDRRRMSLLPWRFRLERGDGAAPAVAAVRALLLRADGDLRQRDDGLAGRDGRRTHRPAGRGGRRRRLAPGGAHGGVVGTRVAGRPDRRERRPGAPVRRARRRRG